ncbi:hypothetical protein Q787_08100 [Ornithobacterium rhinotracheale H06-030791]|nr:hypothetical protein Q785_08290 [Ornithobacterium rhinotracheale ORT-UMN 88]KGB66188.1 hypothetical protein Q787_08100 [Ornithobacterium rhinotracheale H06-030791]
MVEITAPIIKNHINKLPPTNGLIVKKFVIESRLKATQKMHAIVKITT